MWPALNEAIAMHDYKWARYSLQRMQSIMMVYSVVIIGFLSFFSNQLLGWWIGSIIVPSSALLMGYACFRLFAGFTEASMPLMHTSHFLKSFVLISSIAGIATLILKIVFIGRWGLAGIAWAAAIGYGILHMIPINVLAFSRLRSLQAHKSI